ncbi:MAG: RidA family protein [Propionibacteriaceae bacterium]|nr:RidA family protein [Propionibacteriaceae bacterium]
MTSPSTRLAALGLELPAVVAPLAAYTPALRVGSQVWTSGQLPMRDGQLVAVGRLGDTLELADGVAAARQCALNALAAAADTAGGLDNIARVVKVVVFVASDPSFTAQPQVANGASELIGEVFTQPHARSAVGVAVLPLDAPVEVEIIVELNEQ